MISSSQDPCIIFLNVLCSVSRRDVSTFYGCVCAIAFGVNACNIIKDIGSMRNILRKLLL